MGDEKVDQLVFLTQRTFRVLVNSMSRPGKFFPLREGIEYRPLKCVCLTLLDSEVTFSTLGPSFPEEFLREICLLTGARLTKLEEADYVLTSGLPRNELMTGLKVGSVLDPEGGATLIYEVGEEIIFRRTNLRIWGPGISGELRITIKGLDPSFFRTLKALNINYPMGIDLILCYPEGIISITRSTNFEILEEAKR